MYAFHGPDDGHRGDICVAAIFAVGLSSFFVLVLVIVLISSILCLHVCLFLVVFLSVLL